MVLKLFLTVYDCKKDSAKVVWIPKGNLPEDMSLEEAEIILSYFLNSKVDYNQLLEDYRNIIR